MLLQLSCQRLLGLILPHFCPNQRLLVLLYLDKYCSRKNLVTKACLITQGIPASIQIFSSNKDAQTQPIARRSFFRCSTVTMHWNKLSSGLLVVAQSDVDKTNQSYYGESKLNYLTTDGSHEGLVSLSMFCCQISWFLVLTMPTSVIDFSENDRKRRTCAWCSMVLLWIGVCCCLWMYPTCPSCFLIFPPYFSASSIYGDSSLLVSVMPAKATIFDKKGNPLVELGQGPYNTIRFNPKGRGIFYLIIWSACYLISCDEILVISSLNS